MRYHGYQFRSGRRGKSARAALVALVLLGAARSVAAQTANPTVVEFLPSAEHNTPVVTRYDLGFYQDGAPEQFMAIDLGKPAPQADGMIRVNFDSRIAAWPLPNVNCMARVVAVGPGGMGVSNPSNAFAYTCSFALSATGNSVAATAGAGSVQVTAGAHCGWKAASSASWITIGSAASGVGAGTVSYSVAPNSGAARTGTLAIAGGTYTVTQAAGSSTNTPPVVQLTSPSNGATYAPGTAIQVTATASDAGGSVVKVEFFANGALIRTVTTAPYAFTWSPTGSGSYTLQAVAYDNAGANTKSASSGITISGTTNSGTTYLSDLSWKSMTNGWGPAEKDRSNGEAAAGDGRTITLNGQTYAKGIGAHANSQIHYAVNGTCSTFQAAIGLDDEVGSAGSAVFQVWGDGAMLFDSGIMTGTTATKTLNVNIAGKNDLALIITDAANGFGHDHADWADARVTCTQSAPPPPAQATTYLSDIAWTSMTNGWGPVEKNRSNGETGAADGRTITLNGQTYAKGLGGHAGSDVRYAVNGACSSFRADVGVDDEVGSGGSVVFQVWGDGTKLFDSGTMTGTTATKPLDINIAGKKQLALVITDAAAADGLAADHGDWAGARVICNAALPAASTP